MGVICFPDFVGENHWLGERDVDVGQTEGDLSMVCVKASKALGEGVAVYAAESEARGRRRQQSSNLSRGYEHSLSVM